MLFSVTEHDLTQFSFQTAQKSSDSLLSSVWEFQTSDDLLPQTLPKVCSLLEWCFIVSIEVPSDHFQLRCKGFA